MSRVVRFMDATLTWPTIAQLLVSAAMSTVTGAFCYMLEYTHLWAIVLVAFIGMTAIDAGAGPFRAPQAFFVLVALPFVILLGVLA